MSVLKRNPSRGAALVIAILALAILTVIGIALMLITSTESKIAANEWSLNRAFYAADAGIRWARVQLNDPVPFMTRPEFRSPPDPFGTVLFQLPSHRHGISSLFSGDPEDGAQTKILSDMGIPDIDNFVNSDNRALADAGDARVADDNGAVVDHLVAFLGQHFAETLF